MKMLIADDLKSMHHYIDGCANWAAQGIHEILHAYNGMECIELVKRYHPDILLLDIKMPICDGIGVLKALSETDYMPHVLIISAYDDFQYAKQALHYDVVDYLSKPVDTSTLLGVIGEIAKETRRQCLMQLRAYLLNMPIEGYQMGIEDAVRKLKLHEGICALLRFSGNMSRIQHAVSIFQDHYDISVAFSQWELFLISPIQGNGDWEMRTLRDQIRSVPMDAGLRMLAGISRPIDLGEETLQIAYNQCLDALNQHFYTDDTLYVYDTDKTGGSIDAKRVDYYKMEISKCLLDDPDERFTRIVDQMFTELTASQPNQRKLVDVCYNILIYSINYLFISYNSVDTESIGRALLQQLDACGSIGELKEAFICIIRSHMPEGAEPDTPPVQDRMMQEVKAYLRENYMHSLTLESISAEFFISKYELCRKFKALMGENLWEYIQNMRIQKAKQLLTESEYKIYEITNMVGYNDPTYFSNTFKKSTGVSPVQYRNSRQREQ